MNVEVDFNPATLSVGTGTPVARDFIYGVLSVNTRTGDIVLDKSDVGLANVDNTSDATKKSSFTGSIADGDAGFVTGDAAFDALALKADASSVPVATTTTPKMDGTATVGSETKWAKGDHVHPTDTSRMAASLKGTANGVAELDASGKVPTAQLPYSLTHETWTFTLSDGTSATKEVTLWQS